MAGRWAMTIVVRLAHHLGERRRGSRAPWSGRPTTWRRRGSARGGRPGWPGRWRCAGAGRPTASSPARRSRWRSRRAARAMNSSAPASRAARSMRRRSRVGVGEGDVGGDRVAEEERLLEHEADGAAQLAHAERRGRRRRRAATAPAVDVVEAGHQPGDGRLAAAGRPRRGRPTRPARSSRSKPSRTGRRAGVVAERARRRSGPRPTAAAPTGSGDRVGRVDDHAGSVASTSCDPLGRRRRPLALGDDHAEHPQRPDQQHDVDVERDQLRRAAAGRRAPGGRRSRARRSARCWAAARAPAGSGPGPGPPPSTRRRRRRPRLRSRAGLHVLGAEALDHPDAADTVSSTTDGQLGRLLLDGHAPSGCSAVENRLASTLTNGSEPEREQRQQRVDREAG